MIYKNEKEEYRCLDIPACKGFAKPITISGVPYYECSALEECGVFRDPAPLAKFSIVVC